MDELDKHFFHCVKCKKLFHSTQGTWLPIKVEEKKRIGVIGGKGVVTAMYLSDFLRPPEIITSDDFTCYNCT